MYFSLTTLHPQEMQTNDLYLEQDCIFEVKVSQGQSFDQVLALYQTDCCPFNIGYTDHKAANFMPVSYVCLLGVCVRALHSEDPTISWQMV